MDPKVSIIIPFYNCQYVDQAIQSALNQTYSNSEVIVVDDGSTMYAEKITPFFHKIRYVRKENGGTATALNHGIQNATGEYIAWLSSDDYFLPDKIWKQMKFMQEQNAEASFANYDIIDENDQLTMTYCGPRFSDLGEVYRLFLIANQVNGCTVVLKKDLFEKVGYFNPIHRYTHDYEMWFRLLITGHPLHYLDEVLIKYRQHSQSGTSKYQSEIYKEMAIIESCYRPLLKDYLERI